MRCRCLVVVCAVLLLGTSAFGQSTPVNLSTIVHINPVAPLPPRLIYPDRLDRDLSRPMIVVPPPPPKLHFEAHAHVDECREEWRGPVYETDESGHRYLKELTHIVKVCY
jgi:hypothetical protein